MERSSDEQLRIEAAARLARLPVSTPTSWRQLVGRTRRQISQWTGHEVRVVEGTLGGGMPMGMWIATAGLDVLWIQHTTRWHRQVILAHGFGHLLCEHSPPAPAISPNLDDRLWRIVESCPELEGRAISGVMACRESEDRDLLMEREAEVTGRLFVDKLLHR